MSTASTTRRRGRVYDLARGLRGLDDCEGPREDRTRLPRRPCIFHRWPCGELRHGTFRWRVRRISPSPDRARSMTSAREYEGEPLDPARVVPDYSSPHPVDRERRWRGCRRERASWISSPTRRGGRSSEDARVMTAVQDVCRTAARGGTTRNGGFDAFSLSLVAKTIAAFRVQNRRNCVEKDVDCRRASVTSGRGSTALCRREVGDGRRRRGQMEGEAVTRRTRAAPSTSRIRE